MKEIKDNNYEPFHKKNTRRVRLLISGKVQGVYFRKHTEEVANKNRVNGWVRNLSDGCVECLLEGDQSDIQTVIDWCKIGPNNAIVEKVDITDEEYKNEDLVWQLGTKRDELTTQLAKSIGFNLNEEVTKNESNKL